MLDQTQVPEIRKAVMIIHKMSEDEKMQEIAGLREKSLHDEATALGHARRDGEQAGIKKGEKIGIKKGRAEMIEMMRRSGMTEEQIQAVLKS